MTRKELHKVLEDLGIPHVYFQPPKTIQIKYPCVIYKLSNINAIHADDKPYKLDDRYQVTYVSESPTDIAVHEIGKLPKCNFDTFYVMDGLNHYVYSIYA